MCHSKDCGRGIQNKEHLGTSGLWMWFISCPLISLCKFYLFWFCCPLPRPLSISVFRFFKSLSLECLGLCNFSWPWWLRTSLNILFIWLCIKSLFYGAFMPFTILRRRLIGSRAHAPTLSTTRWCADLSSLLSCLAFRNRLCWPI